MNNVVVFRNDLIGLTERFILTQGEGLERYRAHYLGVRRVPGYDPPPERTLMIGGSPSRYDPRALAFKLTGRLGLVSRRMRALAPRLVHAHFAQDAVQILPWARRHRLPLITTFHGYDALVRDEYAHASHYSHRLYVRHKRRLAASGARFIAVSNFLRDRLLESGVFPDSRCVVHYIGVDLDQFAPDRGIAREPVVLFVGRLVETKGCQFLIDAFADVQRAVPRARLVIVGDGPMRSRLEAMARTSVANYEFTGPLPPHEVRRWMARAMVVSVPSIPMHDGYAEALGLVFVEAQASGTPVVTFATGGIPEVVDNGTTGFLVPPRDVRALAQKLVLVLTSDTCWQQFSASARLRMHERFNLREQNRKLELIYDDVVRDSGIASR